MEGRGGRGWGAGEKHGGADMGLVKVELGARGGPWDTAAVTAHISCLTALGPEV